MTSDQPVENDGTGHTYFVTLTDDLGVTAFKDVPEILRYVASPDVAILGDELLIIFIELSDKPVTESVRLGSEPLHKPGDALPAAPNGSDTSPPGSRILAPDRARDPSDARDYVSASFQYNSLVVEAGEFLKNRITVADRSTMNSLLAQLVSFSDSLPPNGHKAKNNRSSDVARKKYLRQTAANLGDVSVKGIIRYTNIIIREFPSVDPPELQEVQNERQSFVSQQERLSGSHEAGEGCGDRNNSVPYA